MLDRRLPFVLTTLLAAATAHAGCASDDAEPYFASSGPVGGSAGTAGQGASAGIGGSAGKLDASNEGGAGGAPDAAAGSDSGGSSGIAGAGGADAADAPIDSADSADAPTDAPQDSGPFTGCPTLFRYKPAGAVASLQVAGEWHGFDLGTATKMTGPDATGTYGATVVLQPGLHAYKLVVDGKTWLFDPGQGRRKYVGGVENSAVKVRDCRLPTFDVQSSKVSRPAPGQGSFQAALAFRDGIDQSGADAGGFTATLEHDGNQTALQSPQISIDATGNVSLQLGALEDGKYRVVVRAKSKSGKVGEPVRLVFWVEVEAFSWKDALIYMVVIDRYRDGDPSNNPIPTPGADPRGDWKGGDLQGVRQSIADGTLDKLGVRAIWLTPFQTNPPDAYLASDGVHKVTGYHGYWPTRARVVEPRIGGETALREMVREAHRHGIRILQDFVLNHVHKDHEYMSSHPGWFRTGCVCGTAGCDWTSHALDCMFSSYMPDIDHTVPEANAAFVDDAAWWLDAFDLDGLRVDAVKHVEEVATRNLAAEVRETFEAAGTRYFLMGETAMGWNDCADPCNDENYGTIAKYIGPFGLDGQFDFVLYHGVSYRTFAYSDKGMLHADYWFQHGQQKWPSGAVMTPYIGSHDTARFATLADYRGQDVAHDRGIPGNQWSNTAVGPADAEPYERTRIALAWLLALPGAPLLYYGDEYGQWGGADPNNRLMWRAEAQLGPNEKATLSFVRALGAARAAVPALRRGEYLSLYSTEDTLVLGRRIASGQAAIVAFTRSSSAQQLSVEVTTKLGFASGTVLHDKLGGADVAVAGNGTIALQVPAKGARVLTP